MVRLWAQGDILIERVDDAPVSGRIVPSVSGGCAILAEGEALGHRHRIFGSVTLYRDDGLATEIPPAEPKHGTIPPSLCAAYDKRFFPYG